MKQKMNFSIKPLLQSFFLSILLLHLAACAVPLEKSGKGQSDDTTQEALIKSAIDLSDKKIGYATPSLNAPYYQALLMFKTKNTIRKKTQKIPIYLPLFPFTIQIISEEQFLLRKIWSRLINQTY